MLRYESATILPLTVMLVTFFQDKSHFKYKENLPAKFQPYMSGHSLAIAHQNIIECLTAWKLATIFTYLKL